MLDFEHARHRMVDKHIARRGVRNRRLLDALRSVPREKFVDEGFEEFAYEDSPLPIAKGQTISQPYVVAHMIEAAELQPGDKVLEVGTGSGYAAAVMSKVAKTVHSMERHARLAELARQRLRDQAIDNVAVHVGDGSRGMPEAAPFDAIIVAAAGHSVPQALKDQLELGGRLIMPVGKHERSQRLVRVTRFSANRFEEEDLGGVMFVPLIGEHGWPEVAPSPAIRAPRQSLPDLIHELALDLPDLADEAFATFVDRFADRPLVLLGEATHGTSEFYRARAAISRRLIERHGFTIVAVEADWPDAAAINRLVRGLERRPQDERPFERFPTWMWRNVEAAEFLAWMRGHNGDRMEERRAGFYGLDLYNMRDSIATVLQYLDKTDPEAASVARERYGCLTPWQNAPSTYGRAVLTKGYQACEQAVVAQCKEIFDRRLAHADDDGEAFLDAAQSARLVAAAEKYYRVMYYGGAESWNLRDRHMFETLEHMLAAKGSQAKAVVWAHNSHVGDARETEMGRSRDELNLGQLCRERFGDEVALVGLGTNSGTVAAASEWDGDMEIKAVRPALKESVEHCFHCSEKGRSIVDFTGSGPLSEALSALRLERFIGVIYRPETERLSHYAAAALSRQFDAYIWFDRTKTVTPLASVAKPGQVPDTFPFGL